ncbi:hypothetical protein [Georgenia wangjunii]|uniref:hypothetical protein n=1 Tax=Georgenia wangjunii TaxID=3117730 RepID=UPI002F261C96
MGSSTRGVVTAALSAVLALAAAFSHPLLVVVVALAVLGFAAGWPRLVGLPTYRGSSAVIAVSGLAACAVVELTTSMRDVAVVLALSVIAAFVHQMLRRDGRPRLVESVAGVVTGAVIVASATGWMAIGESRLAVAVVVTAAAAVAVGAACTAIPLGPRTVAAAAIGLASIAGLATGYLLTDVGPLVGLLAGLVAGVLTWAVHTLFGRFPAAERVLPAVAAAMLPLLLAGAPVYILGRLLTV